MHLDSWVFIPILGNCSEENPHHGISCLVFACVHLFCPIYWTSLVYLKSNFEFVSSLETSKN
jgi:hypothetical protein